MSEKKKEKKKRPAQPAPARQLDPMTRQLRRQPPQQLPLYPVDEVPEDDDEIPF